MLLLLHPSDDERIQISPLFSWAPSSNSRERQLSGEGERKLFLFEFPFFFSLPTACRLCSFKIPSMCLPTVLSPLKIRRIKKEFSAPQKHIRRSFPPKKGRSVNNESLFSGKPPFSISRRLFPFPINSVSASCSIGKRDFGGGREAFFTYFLLSSGVWASEGKKRRKTSFFVAIRVK